MTKGADGRLTGVYALVLGACDTAQFPEFANIESLLGKKARSPLARLLEARSTREFVMTLKHQLIEQGVPQDSILPLLTAVLDYPTFTLQSTIDGVVHVRHAILLIDGDTQHLVSSLVKVDRKTKPPAVVESFIEIVSDNELLSAPEELMPFVRGWWNQLSTRGTASPYHGMPHTILWCGDPNRLGLTNTPTDWRSILADTSRILGLSPHFASSVGDAKSTGHSTNRDLDLVVFLTKGAADEFSEFFQHEVPMITLLDDTYSFSSTLAEAQRELVQTGLEAHQADSNSTRMINIGETIYHRKIPSGSGRKYDLFDIGTSSPCQHGESSYVPFGGDKSRKGMARRYTNFEPRMLFHCRKYPNCNVYAIRG